MWIQLFVLDREGQIKSLRIYMQKLKDTNIHNLIYIFTFPDQASGKWYNRHCEESHGFICKRILGNTGKVTDLPTPTIGGYCPKNYFGVVKVSIIMNIFSIKHEDFYMSSR